MEKNGKVEWKSFILIIGIATTILGILWNGQVKLQNDMTEVKIDAKETRTMLNALISRINGGQITIKLMGEGTR